MAEKMVERFILILIVALVISFFLCCDIRGVCNSYLGQQDEVLDVYDEHNGLDNKYRDIKKELSELKRKYEDLEDEDQKLRERINELEGRVVILGVLNRVNSESK